MKSDLSLIKMNVLVLHVLYYTIALICRIVLIYLVQRKLMPALKESYVSVKYRFVGQTGLQRKQSFYTSSHM